MQNRRQFIRQTAAFGLTAGLLPGFALAPAAGAAMSGNASAAAGRPNIVWILVEDMNDWMGCYGDKTVPTPNIDSIAARGVRFDRAPCRPRWASTTTDPVANVCRKRSSICLRA
jgi:hypothetical protein